MDNLSEKHLIPKMVDFVLGKRFCHKCMDEFIEKEKIKDKDKLNLYALLGVCSRCMQQGVVYYIDGKYEVSKV